MIAYRVCDMGIDSNIPFVELPRSRGAPAELSFRLGLNRPNLRMTPRWLHQRHAPNGRIWMVVGELGHEYLVRFPHYADFFVSAERSVIRAHRRRDIPLRYVRHLLLDQVLPMMLSRQGKLVLHAGSVLAPQGAVAFVGRSGMGKSTLTASMVRSGFPQLADDFVLLRESESGLIAVPSYPGVRLWADSAQQMFGSGGGPATRAGGKRRCGVGNRAVPFAEGAAPLARAYLLGLPGADDGDAVRVMPVSAGEVFGELVRQCFRLDVSDRGSLRLQFEALGRVAALPIYRRLVFPRRYSALSEVHAAILDDLSSGPSLS